MSLPMRPRRPAGVADHCRFEVADLDARPEHDVREGDDTLVVPDYLGNSFFNTFGNLQLDS